MTTEHEKAFAEAERFIDTCIQDMGNALHKAMSHLAGERAELQYVGFYLRLARTQLDSIDKIQELLREAQEDK